VIRIQQLALTPLTRGWTSASTSLLLALTLTAIPGFAQTAGQDMKSAGTATKDAAKDTGNGGVKTGTTKAYHKTATGTKTAATKTATGTKTVASKTATGTKTVGKDVGHDTKVGATKTVNGTKTVGKDVGHGAKVGADDTANGTKKLGDKIAGKPTPQ